MTHDFRRFVTVDVFTDRIFSGNPVAVVLDAEGLTTEQMQAIAREFNYVESTFVFPPQNPEHTARVRIFTPAREVPFAGHPNIGTAFALARQYEQDGLEPVERMIFEEDAGLVRVNLTRDDGKLTGAELICPEPFSRRGHLSVAQAARCLGLEPEDVRSDMHLPLVASVGLPFLIVELTSRDALRRSRLNRDALSRFMPLDGAHSIYAYTLALDREDDDVDLQARMFTAFGAEDPATGSATSAASALIAQLRGEPHLKLRTRQGVDMGRPSTLIAEVMTDEKHNLIVKLAGQCVAMMRGEIQVS